MSCDMEKTMSSVDSLPATPASEVPVLTVSPADTSLNSADVKTKRAKTEDEKEQRRIERVLRNRAAAQTSRERKRLEMEKLENEKIQMEQQNQFLLQRLSQMEAENNRLSQQLAQLAAEVRGSRANTPMPGSPATASPTLTPTLFKQERDELPLERIPFPTPSLSDYSPTLKPSTLAESSDVAQHPAAVLYGSALPLFDLGSDLKHHSTDDVAAPLSDDDFNRLFHGDSSVEPDSSVFEDGLAFDVLEGGDLSAFPFDSMVNFDSEPVTLEGIEMAHGLPDETTCKTSSVQPGFGASTTRCDGQGIAAGC
ncbi:hypothetical protein AO1008_02939 [Aspergillus oryzae 100-8]|uniref:BZIP domain-containing protein n=1 Tax=Aspergillus oryzae (strain 3.042) TaxID=1160506 RepID=I8A7Z1_ASPO3|nr:hypothetical protein Ao3042_02335 [Aspergillus oryzae 3.042]KDE85833.1 hypothetical protein AO1008_02939 [Aspergillus oryzae 100-8]|eukprot:EIT81287.1 hypothetical protein Ao3042_02335 [Aspergillus oryzae 3.042]